MSFWDLSDGKQAESQTEFEMGGGSEPIPDNTDLKACIDEAGWKTWEADEYIELRWTVLDGQFKNRKVFQKVRVKDADPKRRDKALRMLAAIDANCGGKLRTLTQEPEDFHLTTALCNKPMVIKVMVWEMNNNKGNWVSKVSSASAATSAPADPFASVPDENIPF